MNTQSRTDESNNKKKERYKTKTREQFCVHLQFCQMQMQLRMTERKEKRRCEITLRTVHGAVSINNQHALSNPSFACSASGTLMFFSTPHTACISIPHTACISTPHTACISYCYLSWKTLVNNYCPKPRELATGQTWRRMPRFHASL